jgi:hypothetical protein
MKFVHIKGTFFAKLKFFFHQVLFSINPYFSLLRETLYAGRVKLFGGELELFAQAVCELVFVRKGASPPNASFRGPKRWKSEGAKGVGRMMYSFLFLFGRALRIR